MTAHHNKCEINKKKNSITTLVTVKKKEKELTILTSKCYIYRYIDLSVDVSVD